MRRIILATVLACLLPYHLFAAIGGIVPTTAGGGGTTTLTTAVVINPGSTQTNVPITFGLPIPSPPIATAALASSQHITVSDSQNGALTCGEDNRASDLSANVGLVTVSCIIPSWTGSATDTLTISTASGAPASGTDITTANITATAYDLALTVVDQSGTTFTASPLDAFNSGNASYVNATTAAILGKWRGGNGLVTGYISYVPFHNGGTPHADLFAKFDTECYKATTGAVSGGNPILRCKTTPAIQSGQAQGSAADYWYSLTVGASSACASFPTSSPSTTLTLASNTANTVTTATAGSSIFSLNNVGNLVTDGTGWGVVVAPAISGTQINIGVIKPFAGTSLSSGNWKLNGINHPWMQRYPIRCDWTPGGGTVADANGGPSVYNGQLYLGNAWDGIGGANIGPATYVISTGKMMNFLTTPSQVTNFSIAGTIGTNPTGFSGGQFAGGATKGDGTSGSWNMFQESTGNFDGVTPTPASQAGALIRYDSNAASTLFANTDRFALIPDHFIDKNTGLTPTLTSAPGGTNWAFNPAYTNVTLVPFASAPTADSLSSWSTYPQSAHGPDPYFLPYILSGDWWYLDNAVDLVMSESMEVNPGYAGNGLTQAFLSGGTQLQMRGDFHFHRNLGHLALILPDSDTNSTPSKVVGWTKDDTKSYLESQYTAVNSGSYLSNPQPGTNIAFNISCGGHTCNTNWQTPGPRWLELNGTARNQFAQYQLSYGMHDESSLYETGMLSANGLAFFKWAAVGSISVITDTTEVSALPIAGIQWHCCNDGPHYDWTTQYQRDGDAYYGAGPTKGDLGPGRTPTGSATLSATTGNNITVTIPTGYLGSGTYYAGIYFATSDGGMCAILASPAPTATTFHCDETATFGHAFGATSYTNSAWSSATWALPWAAPADGVGLEHAGVIAAWTSGAGTYGILGYIQISQSAAILICSYIPSVDSGCSGAWPPSAVTTILGLSGGSLAPYDPIDWNIGHR